MIKPTSYPFNPPQVLWSRLEEAIIMPTIDNTLKDFSSNGHMCIFWDYRELLDKCKDQYNPIYGVTLFEISDDDYLGGEIHALRKKTNLKEKIEGILKSRKVTVMSHRIVRIDGEGQQIFLEEAALEFKKIFLLFFIDFTTKDQHKYFMGGCKEGKDEIDNLTFIRAAGSRKFEESLASLIAFQEVEYQAILKEHARNRRSKTMKSTSDILVLLRSLHNTELKSIQTFQEAFFKVISSNLRCLLARVGDPSVPDMVEKAESCRACHVLLRLIYSNNKRPDKGNNTNTTEEDNSALKTKAAFLKASLPVIKGGIKDSPADELDQTQTIENITARHQRINSTRVDVMQLKPVTPRRDRSVQKYSQRNEQSTPFLYSKDSGGSLLAVESKEYSSNSYMEPQIKGFMSAKKPSNTYFESLINNNIKPREIRTILNPRQTQTQMQMNRSDEVNNSYITSFKTNHDDSKDLKASNKSYLDYLNESSSQYKPKIVIQGKKEVVGQINTGQILTMESVKSSDQAIKQDDLSNRGSGRGTDNMLKELYIKDKETAAGRLLEPNSLEGTVKVDDNIEKDSLTDEGIELKDNKENLDSARKKPPGYNNESFLLDNNMRSSKGRLTQGSQLFRTLRSMKATSQRPQRSILKSPDVRKFYSKGNDDEEARSALFDFLNKTDLNDSLMDGDSRHVSFAANQVSQERVITPSNKGKKVIRITSFAMKGGVNSSSDYFGEGISSLKNILGVNTDNAGSTNKISRQRGRRSYRPMDAKTTKQGLDESGGQESEQKNDMSGVSSGSNVIPVVDEKERFTKLMQDHIKKHNQFPRTIVYHDSEITTEKEAYIQRLLAEKPWFERSTLQWYNFEALKENFPLPAEPVVLQGREKQEFDEEIKFIMEKVVPLKDKARDSKSDLELAYDLRYYGRYGDMLLKRIKTRNFYQRLDLAKTCSDSDVKAAFRTKALMWHPDNIKKTFKHCFANEALYASTAASIFSLIDEAYKTLSNANKRTAYNTTIGS